MNTRKFVKSNCKADINFALQGLWNEIDRLSAMVAALNPTNEGSEEISDEGASETEVVEPTGEAAPVEAPAEPLVTGDPVADESDDETGDPVEPTEEEAPANAEAIAFIDACNDRQKLYEFGLSLKEPVTLKRNKSLADMKVDALAHVNK